jgi:glycosyltransferase involved in cell wall biosynthesis
LRVAIVAPLVTAIAEPPGGGSQAFVADLARGLAGRGHDVAVYAATGSRIPGVTVIDTGIDPASLAATLFRADGPDGTGQAEGADPDPGPAGPAFASVYAAVRQARHDVVHNHAFDVPAVDQARDLGAPVVHTLHLPPDPAMAAALDRAAASGTPTAVACVSRFQAAAWRAVTRVDAVLPPLIPTGLIGFRPEAGAGAGAGAVFAGRLSPEKGAADAIDIARAAGISIDVYGDAYDPEYAREQVAPRGAEPGVTLHPGVPRAELWPAMARAAVLLCPSQWDEPFGMAPAEAQACGTPVVAYRRGGLGEVIIDGVTGFLVAPGDIAAAADAVRRAAGLSRRACRDHAVSHLDLERSLDAHEQLYQRLAGTSTPAAAPG